MKYLRLLAISSCLILLGMVVLVPTDKTYIKLIVEGILMLNALFWYNQKDLRI